MWRMFMFLVLLYGCARAPLFSQPDGGPTGHLPPDRSTVPPVAVAAHKLTPGEVLFLRHCAGCHGAGARGDGSVGTALGLHPRNLRQAGLFPEDHDPAWINRILHGKAMPVSVSSSQELASDTEVNSIVQHLRRLPTLPWSEIDQGEKIYDSLCLSCHGVYGHGDGPVVKTLPVPPRDLMAPPYQQQMTDEALFQVISEGKGAMPGSADILSIDDRKAVVAFVRLLIPGYESFDRYCVGCHGNKGRPVSREILDVLGQGDSWTPPPALDKEFFRQRTDEQLRKSVRHMLTLNRAPMPHFAGELTADQVRQVLSYLRSLPPES
jgi:mono/diheme cytochrome c family protein